MYRPDGWKNPYIHERAPRIVNLDLREEAYEAGADAMLEGLRENRIVYFGGGSITGIHIEGLVLKGPGHLVFIPEEKP